MNYEMVFWNNGSPWLLADLWRCPYGGDVSRLVWDDDGTCGEPDWVADSFRIGNREHDLWACGISAPC